MNVRVTLRWVALALIGLAIAVGVAIAAANLTSQQIGIASESVSAGDALAPSLRTAEEREEQHGQGRRDKSQNEKPAPIPAEPTGPGQELPGESTEPEQRSDDYGGGGGDD